jgi:hypothetical protein
MSSSSKKSKLTDEQVTEMLSQLSEHFGERVAPVSQYCDGFYKYMHAVREEHKDDPTWASQMRAFSGLRLTIDKSNLLARLIYGGEHLRTRKCPIHKGVWTGCELSAAQACRKGCGLTGWIKEPEDGGPPLGSPESEWVCTTQWITYENGESRTLSYEDMLERERKQAEEREKRLK